MCAFSSGYAILVKVENRSVILNDARTVEGNIVGIDGLLNRVSHILINSQQRMTCISKPDQGLGVLLWGECEAGE